MRIIGFAGAWRFLKLAITLEHVSQELFDWLQSPRHESKQSTFQWDTNTWTALEPGSFAARQESSLTGFQAICILFQLTG